LAYRAASSRDQKHLSGEAGLFVSCPASPGGAGWLQSSWGESENNRRAKFYQLTQAGERQLKTETGDWQRISFAIESALQTT
jgi:hypothetical protein